LHKDNLSIQPLINFKTTPSYNLATLLDLLIKQKLKFTCNMAIKNTYDFIEKINNINIELRCKMISLDVKNLNTSISTFGALNILKNNFTLNNNFNQNEIYEVI